MKSLGGGAKGRLPAALMILGAALLLAACGSSNGNGLDDAMEPEMPMAEVPEETVTELGAWNAPMAGGLAVRDANGVLDVHYDGDHGHIVVDAPVQPSFTGTATWSGMWSGRVELNPDPLTTVGLAAFGVDAESFEELGGGALVRATIEGDGVMATLTYRDLGLEDIGLTEIASDPGPVTNGLFRPQRMYTHMFDFETTDPFDPSAPTMMTHTTVTGDFTGEGAFGGAGAAGVAGHVGGMIHIDYGRGPTYLGTLLSVFYGNRDQN